MKFELPIAKLEAELLVLQYLIKPRTDIEVIRHEENMQQYKAAIELLKEAK